MPISLNKNTYDDSGFTGASIPSANIFTNSIVGGPALTSSATDSVTYNGMTFTPLVKAALSATTLAPYDTLILYEVCDIATSLTTSQHDAINAYLAAGNKILLYDSDRCATGTGNGGVADYSWFTYPFSTSSPGPQGASGVLTVVENSSLTQGLSSDPFNSDELGDANTATTTDPHWFAAAKTTNALGNNGYFLAYARNTGLIIYDGADHWFTSSPTQSLTDLFLNELNQVYDPDNLPSSVPIANIHYFAFGDSYSSGEGNPPFFPGTDTKPDFCHRSPQAYSQFLGTALKLQPLFYSCSGAVTADITKPSYYGEPPQLTNLPTDVNATFGLATMTIGGNDARFGPVVSSCIEQKLMASIFNAQIGPIAVWLGLGMDPSCAHSPSFVNSENAKIDSVSTPVKNTYLALLKHVSQTDTSVIVADYPHLFPDSSKEQSCFQLAPFLTTADQQYFNVAGDRLDNVLAKAAAQAGVNFVDVRSIFAGHGVCGNGGAWINGLSLASSNGCTLSVAGKCIIPSNPVVGSFHPNAKGDASGYAVAIENYITSATNRTVEGYPANPLAATGFTLPGSKAGVIFIDAIGTGPGGVHADDVGMEGLAKPGSTCSTTQLPFKGFDAPVTNFPHVNTVRPGASITVKFDLPGIYAPLNDAFASGYPQSARCRVATQLSSPVVNQLFRSRAVTSMAITSTSGRLILPGKVAES